MPTNNAPTIHVPATPRLPKGKRGGIELLLVHNVEHLGKQGIAGRTVTLKIRLAPFRTFTRSRTLPEATSDPEAVAAAGRALFDAFERDAPVRLLGVGVSNLVHPDKRAGPAAGDEAPEAGPVQLALD